MDCFSGRGCAYVLHQRQLYAAWCTTGSCVMPGLRPCAVQGDEAACAVVRRGRLC